MSQNYDRYFLSYSGAKLPLKLVGPLTIDEIDNRNTYFGACVDEEGREILIHKVVYGEVEMEHRYGYKDGGELAWAEILNVDDEMQRLEF